MTARNILRWILLGGIFLVPFIPFIVSGSLFFPFITGKNITFRIITELIIGAWIILALYDARYRPRWSLMLSVVGIFVAVILVADLSGVNIMRSIWSNFERMEGWITLIHLFGYLLALVSVLTTEKLWTRLLQTSIGASIIMSSYGLLQIAGLLTINQGGVRVDGTFGNATYLAVYLLFHIFLTLMLFVQHRGGRWGRILYGLIILLQAFILYHTATRGALLGLFGGLVLTALIVAIYGREHPRARKYSIGALILAVIVVGGFFTLRTSSFVQESPVLTRFAGISLEDGSTRARFTIWKMAWNGFTERPILGWGQDNFNLIFNTHYDPNLFDQEQWFDRAHNVVLDWLTAGGVLGVLSYLTIFVAALIVLWRQKTHFTVLERALLIGLLAAYFFHNLFVFDNIMSYILFMMVLALIHTGMGRRKVMISGVSSEASGMHHATATAVAIVVLVLMYVINVPGVRAGHALVEGLRPQPEGLDENLMYFEKAIDSALYGTPEIRERFLLTAQQIGAAEEIPQQQREVFVGRAYEEMQAQLEKTPRDARQFFLVGTFLDRFGRYEEARAMLLHALEFSPGKQTIMFELTNNYLASEMPNEALQTAREAFELAPQFEAPRRFYGATAIRVGEREVAEELLIPVYGTILIDDDQFLRAYAAVDDFQSVVGILDVRIQKDPSNLEAYLAKTAALTHLGRIQGAIETIDEAIARNPDFRVQGEQIKEEIRSGKFLEG